MTLVAPDILPSRHVADPLVACQTLSPDAFARVRRRMILDCCKWDPQVGDVSTLAPFPLFIRRREWRQIAMLAERLAAELMTAEQELLDRPELWKLLGIPRRLRRILKTARSVSPGAVRALRFDFHWTDDGWRISEVNSDVPGGYAEASALPRLVAEHFDGAQPVGQPDERWADAVQRALGASAGEIALVAAPGFMEDQQVVAYLARVLERRGLKTRFANPSTLIWHDDLAAVVRFYQAEWLARLPRRARRPFFSAGSTLITNPGVAVLTESKRFPLVWPKLRTSLPTWQKLLPQTRDPRDVDWRSDDRWLLKSAFCNTGDTVSARSLVTPKRWRAAARSVWWSPGNWVAQRRFETLPITTPVGEPMFPCVGVYTVNGQAAGAYTRLSRGPIVDYRAMDVALLMRADDDDVDRGDEARP